jgi:RHS repeat-associated protein
MPGRKFTAATQYRYGFNGKEEDDEVKGDGNQQDYGMRIYDPRLGKFLSVDPITKNYPMLTPYQFASNRPIDGIDLDGLEYLDSKTSKIDMSIFFIEFNGKRAVYGSVIIDLRQASLSTAYIVNSQPWESGQFGSKVGILAKFEGANFKMISKQLESAHKTPDISDIETPKSIIQPELEVQRVAKDKAESQQIYRSKQFTVPSGGGASAKGDAIVAMVQWTADIIQHNQGSRLEQDFNNAKQQIWAAQQVANDVQFALDQNLIAPSYYHKLGGLANYLLDGKVPTRMIDGKEFTDNSLLRAFQNIQNNIITKKLEKGMLPPAPQK